MVIVSPVMFFGLVGDEEAHDVGDVLGERGPTQRHLPDVLVVHLFGRGAALPRPPGARLGSEAWTGQSSELPAAVIIAPTRGVRKAG